jgi:hypothetical protein
VADVNNGNNNVNVHNLNEDAVDPTVSAAAGWSNLWFVAEVAGIEVFSV